MKFTVIDFRSGEVKRYGDCPEDDFGNQAHFEGEAVVEGNFDPSEYWFVDSTMARRPSPHHRYDPQTKAWSCDLDVPRAQKKLQLEAERARRAQDVIVYDGKRLDADARAQGAIASKLSAITSCEATGRAMDPRALVWRDADNITHSFESQDKFKAWLHGLVVAIDARDAATTAWCWQQKVLLAKAASLPEINAIPQD